MAAERSKKHEWKPWLTLPQIAPFEPYARAWGVSAVARSPKGFLPQYKRAGGDPRALSEYWWNRRQDFVARHMAQAIRNNESFLKTGALTKRHVALIMWAYSPIPKLALKNLRELKRSLLTAKD